VLVEHTKQAQNPLGIDVIYIWVIGVILSVINISLCFLDLTLVVFHTYLCIRQITTYEYITGKVSKRKKEQKEKNKERSFREPERGSAHYVPHPPPPRALPTFNASPYAAAMPVQESQEESSSADSGDSADSSSPESDGGVVSQGANVFRSFVAQEGDTEMKKEVSSVIFGSSVTGVGEPEHSPEAAGGQGHQSAL